MKSLHSTPGRPDSGALRIDLLLVLGVGLGARLGWWAYAGPEPVSDFAVYLDLGRGLRETGQFGSPEPTAYRLPGFPLYLSWMLSIRDSIPWLSFGCTILSAALIPLVYWLASSLTDNRAIAFMSSLLCALHPTLIYFAPVLASEHLFAALLISALVLLARTTSGSPGRTILHSTLAGSLFALAILVRGEGIFYLPAAIGFLLLLPASPQVRLRSALAILLVVGIGVAPWWLRNQRVVGSGAGLSTSSGVNFYYAHNSRHYGWHPLEDTPLAGLDEVQRNRRGFEAGLTHLHETGIGGLAKSIWGGTKRLYGMPSLYSVIWSTRGRPLEKGSAYTERALPGLDAFKWSTALSYYALLLGALLSVAFLRRYPPRVWTLLYGIVLLNWIGFAWILWGKARYRYVPEVLFCILTAIAIHGVASWSRSRTAGSGANPESAQ